MLIPHSLKTRASPISFCYGHVHLNTQVHSHVQFSSTCIALVYYSVVSPSEESHVFIVECCQNAVKRYTKLLNDVIGEGCFRFLGGSQSNYVVWSPTITSDCRTIQDLKHRAFLLNKGVSFLGPLRCFVVLASLCIKPALWWDYSL